MAKTRIRFLRKVAVAGPGECWLFRKTTVHNPYGRFMINGVREQAHRASWILHNGPIPNGLKVLHRCDTPACCNPAHLFLGTQKDNMQDCARKGRRTCNPASGADHGHAYLKPEVVKSILADVQAGKGSQKAIAARYGTSQGTVSNIKLGRHWGVAA